MLERLQHRVACFVLAGQFDDALFHLAQLFVAKAQQADALLVACKRLLKAGRAVVEIVNDLFEFDQGVSKVDHQLTAKDRLSGRYFVDHFRNGSIYNDGNLLTYRGGSNQSRVRTQNAVLSWTRTISPSTLNEFNFESPATLRYAAHAKPGVSAFKPSASML